MPTTNIFRPPLFTKRFFDSLPFYYFPAIVLILSPDMVFYVVDIFFRWSGISRISNLRAPISCKALLSRLLLCASVPGSLEVLLAQNNWCTRGAFGRMNWITTFYKRSFSSILDFAFHCLNVHVASQFNICMGVIKMDIFEWSIVLPCWRLLEKTSLRSEAMFCFNCTEKRKSFKI